MPQDVKDHFWFLDESRGTYDEALGRLTSLSLVKRAYAQRLIYVHPMIHEWIHLRMPEASCGRALEQVLSLLCNQLPPLLYSTGDIYLPQQAESVFCHLERVAEMTRLNLRHLQDVRPECAVFFLEAFLWYRGNQYLDLAEQVARHVNKKD